MRDPAPAIAAGSCGRSTTIAGFAAAGQLGLALWSAWSEALGARLVEPTGVVYFDRRGDDEAARAFRSWLDRGVASVRELGGVAEERCSR